jgi:DNA topoisomerase-3
MMKSLYIAEKASVGKALADVLPGVKMRDTNFIRCGEDIVAWASGHLLELCEPEDYDEKFKTWGRGTLLYVPDKWRLKVKERTKGLFSGLSKLIKGLDSKTDTIVNVGDADREGELLIGEILDYCGWKGKTLRLRLNDINPEAIRKALGNIRDGSEFQGEYRAGQARLYADWLCGLTMTRFVTVSLREAGYGVKAMSVGRVQTPTLGLVVAREREIQGFVPAAYFDLRASLTLDDGRNITGRWVSAEKHGSILDGQKRITDRDAVEAIAVSLEGKNGEITSVTKQSRKSSPPLPYSLPKLQIAASKKYDMTDTLGHVQKLYESGLVTYPRTECEHIPEGHFTEAGKIIEAIRSGCLSLSDMLDGVNLNRKSAAWDDKKITEHHAILPTAKVPLEDSLTETERKIYELVCARYVLQFLADYEYEETLVEFGAGGEVFRAAGRTVVNLGWQGWDKQDEKDQQDKDKARQSKETEEKGEDDGDKRDSQVLPSVHKGESGLLHASVEEKFTKPPKPYTYHALLSAMNGIHAFVEDTEIRAKLKEIQGIGTAATQEPIISTLFERGYIEKKKKIIQPTGLGRLLIRLLSEGKASIMVRPDLTALWERRMDEIQDGSASLDDFVAEVAEMVRGIISDRLNIPEDVSSIPSMERLHRCLTPGCGGFLRHISKPGKMGKKSFFSCSVCHSAFNDVNGIPAPKKERSDDSGEIIEAPCPLACGKNALRYEGKYGPFWKCACSPDVTFKDVAGAPVLREARVEVPCPATGCKGKAIRLMGKKNGRLFWKCGACGNFFDDRDGKPALRKGKSKKQR